MRVSARRQAYLERYRKEPPALVLRRGWGAHRDGPATTRTGKLRRSPLPGVFSALHITRLSR